MRAIQKCQHFPLQTKQLWGEGVNDRFDLFYYLLVLKHNTVHII